VVGRRWSAFNRQLGTAVDELGPNDGHRLATAPWNSRSKGNQLVNRLPSVLIIIGTVSVCFLVHAEIAAEESETVPDFPVSGATTEPGGDAGQMTGDLPWWKQRKIVLMWGHWWPSRQSPDGSDQSKRDPSKVLPRSVFHNLAQAGATVFVENWGFEPANARLAHEFGLRSFASAFAYDISTEVGKTVPGARRAVTRTGEWSDEKQPWCPLDDAVYEKWMVTPFVEGLHEGILDGLHFDWEPYGKRDEAGICFGDDCFSKFLSRWNIAAQSPDKTERFGWLRDQGLIDAYEQTFNERRVEMFTRLVGKLRAINPHLLFSSYRSYRWGWIKAVHAPETPFIVLARRHYHTDDRQAWWESYSAWMKDRGYLCIVGGHKNALFGAQTSQVSAARWMYESAINEDGFWLWFQRPLDDEILRAYATADGQIKAVEHAVGPYLFSGKQDRHFVTAVEWSGRPALAQALVIRTHHLGDEHLVHVNNGNTQWPLRVRLRFPNLRQGRRWTVKDPMSRLYYSREGQTAQWTTAELKEGLLVPMEPRSDLFLLLSPVNDQTKVDPSALVRSRHFDALQDHASASTRAVAEPMPRPVTRLKNSIFGDELEAMLASTRKILVLPKEGWHFRRDYAGVGEHESFYLPEHGLEGWSPIEIETFWGDKGGTGAGWYRGDIEVPPLPNGRRVYLHFDAVDEELVLWIDGKHAGDFSHPRGPDYGWISPFAIDVTGKLTEGKHHLSMRVHNVAGAGGVWKPVSVLVGPQTGATVTAMPAALGMAGHEGQLVYTATESMGYQGDDAPLTIANAIRAIDVSNINQMRLRQLRGHLWSPACSPDGKRIAFVHDAGGRGQIYVMNADGSDAVNVSNNAYCDRSAVWSHDSSKLAFMSDRDGDWDIFVMNADGSGRHRVAGNRGVDRAPAWSPDGSRLAWESHVSGVPTIWICDADGRNSRPLIDTERPPIVEIFDRTLLIPDTFYLTNPLWSPDGRRIAAAMLHHHIGYRVVIVQADGTRLTEVARSKGPPIVQWSPDGKQLAVAGWVHAQYPWPELTFIFLAHADFKPNDPRFTRTTAHGDIPLLEIRSPPGPRQVFANELAARGDVHDLRTWYSHGSSIPRRVLKRVYALAWSPNGGALAFSSDMDPSGAFHVYIVSREGGTPQQLEGTASAWPQQISWRPH
jgi:Tol biopolymer transport system component